MAAAFGRLCVETHCAIKCSPLMLQPPSGGCVLKQQMVLKNKARKHAAAFGRLCVETANRPSIVRSLIAAAFGRLCVETLRASHRIFVRIAAAFGRLCVETKRCRKRKNHYRQQPPSGGCVLKLSTLTNKFETDDAAAFGRLCVETNCCHFT